MKIFSQSRIGNPLLGLAVIAILLGNGCGWISGGSNEDFLKSVRMSDDRKRVTSAVGTGTKVYRGTPSQMASQFLNDNVERLGLTTGLGDLRLRNEKVRRFGTNVEFEQILNGLPVENGQVKVNFDKYGHVVQLVSSYTPPAGALDQTNVNKERAAEIVINEFLRTTPHNPTKAEQQKPQGDVSKKIVNKADLQMRKGDPQVEDVFFSRNGRLHRAYRISITAARPFGSKLFVIDANSAEIVQTKNFVYNWVDGQGQVFIPNPVNSLINRPGVVWEGVTTEIPTDNPNPYFTRSLPGLLALNAPFTLRGPFVVLEDIEGPSPYGSPPSIDDANGFNFTHHEPGFEDVMIYYHVDRMQRYIQTELYFTDVMNRCLYADAHGLWGGENSHYVSTPGTLGHGYVAFGDEGVEDAEDADVIAHEYGHAIQDNQAPGTYAGGGYPRAMGEGFSDYWAFSTYDQDTIDHGHERPCLMEWDAIPDCLRRVDDGPGATSFSYSSRDWENGKIWSTTLFRIFESLGRKTADTLILQSHFNISRAYPSFQDAAEAIITANEQIFVDQPAVVASNRTTLCGIFTAREIYTVAGCPSY